MKIENIDIQATIEKAQLLIREDKQLSAATKSMFEILILIITLLAVAQRHPAIFRHFENLGTEGGASVGTVAERLGG